MAARQPEARLKRYVSAQNLILMLPALLIYNQTCKTLLYSSLVCTLSRTVGKRLSDSVGTQKRYHGSVGVWRQLVDVLK